MIEVDFAKLKKVYDRNLVRKFKDMKDSYKNTEGIKGDPLIYVVYIKDFGSFEVGLTCIEAGTINKEFFMTKGHRHKKSFDELYILISGKGKLLIQDKKARVFDLKKGKGYIVPGKAGHRLINTENKKLEVLTIYSKNAGHDYKFKFKKRVFK